MPTITNQFTGGKKNVAKPSAFLRALRHVSRFPADADKDELQRELRKVKTENFLKFADMLAKAEGEQSRKRTSAKLIEARREMAAQSASGAAASPSSAAPESDLGTAAALELIEKLLEGKGWLP